MKFELSIDADNVAFQDNPAELSRILRSLADHLESRLNFSGDTFPLRDVNGNTVGEATFTED